MSITDSNVNTLISDLAFFGGEFQRTWIGAIEINGTWTWADGTPWNYESWLPGEPTGDGSCAETNFAAPGKWNDLPCSP